MNSFLRPNRSVSWPKNRAPETGAGDVDAPAKPIWELRHARARRVGGLRASDIEPTMVTSSPSRIQTVPSPITISQCHRAHGSRTRCTRRPPPASGLATRFRVFTTRFHELTEQTVEAYRRSLEWVLRRQRETLIVTMVTLVATILLYMIIPKGFLPLQDTLAGSLR